VLNRPTNAKEEVARERVVHLDVNDTTLRLALSFVAEDAGWRRGGEDEPHLTVSDRLQNACRQHPVDVLVVRAEPAACQAAVHAVAEGRARAVVAADDPERLPAALDAAAAGFVLMAQSIVAIANLAPVLGERLVATLRLVASGLSNPAIARRLHESESTAKRDVAELVRLLDVSSRAEVSEAANRLGFRTSQPA
jgi:DNA-binding NarL/FixJ family response regulator